MNEYEENIYNDIKNELVQSIVDKKIDTYFTNKNELTHYYNVGKKIIDAQGGVERAKYGDNLIKKYSERLTKQLEKGYDVTTLKRMRKFYLLIQKGAPLAHQLSWTHYIAFVTMKDINEITYYIEQTVKYHLSKRALQERIKNKEYQRLSEDAKIN